MAKKAKGASPAKAPQQSSQADPLKPSRPGRSMGGEQMIFLSLQFVAVAATVVSLIFLVMLLSRYGWQLPT